MAHACSTRSVTSQPENQATVYVEEWQFGNVPEDTFDPDGWPTTIRFVGPGANIVVDIDSDD